MKEEEVTPRSGENHVRVLRGGGDGGNPAIVALQDASECWYVLSHSDLCVVCK